MKMGFNVRSRIKVKSVLPLFIIMALFAVAKLFFLFRYHLPIWDEAVYLGMGKYIYSLGSSGLWEMLRPPALPFLIGWVWKLKLPYTFFAEVITLLFGAASIYVSYLIADKVFSRKVAILAAALLATSPLFYLYSSFILTEVPALFFVLAALYFFIKRRYYFCGASAALAMLFKFPNGLVLVAIAAAVIISGLISRKPLWPQLVKLVKVAASFFLVTLPFLAFNYVFYRAFTSNPYDAIFRPFILGVWHQSNPAKAIASPLLNYLFYVVEAFKQHFVFVLGAIAVFVFFKKKWYSSVGKMLLASFLVVYAAYFTYIPNKDERFLILFLPAICLFTAAAFFETVNYFKGAKKHVGHSISHIKAVRSFALVAAISLLVLSFAVAAYKDYHFYSWRTSSEPAVVSELYKSVSKLGIKGAVLTSEPVFSAYNDNPFFPYYFTYYESIPQELKALNEWEQNKSFEAVIYSRQTLFCQQFDTECQAAKANMYDYLQSNFKEVFIDSYYDGRITYLIFANASLYGKPSS
ncbi:MAG: glycosyltransferase family 39 protein [Nanoarchaeota archaeon]